MKYLVVHILMCVFVSFSRAQSTTDITVTLKTPGEQMLLVEESPIEVTITNNSCRTIPLVKDIRAALRFQVIFDIGAKNPYSTGQIYGTSDRFVSWEHRLRNAKDSLSPGQAYTWEFRRWTELTDHASKIGATNIAVRVMIGDDEWVRSETLPFSVNEEDSQGAGLLEKSAAIECHDPKTGARTGTIIRKVKLGSKSFLFTNDGTRLCELSEGETPEASFDSEKGIIIVSFSNGKRSVRYDIHQKKVLLDGYQK